MGRQDNKSEKKNKTQKQAATKLSQDKKQIQEKSKEPCKAQTNSATKAKKKNPPSQQKLPQTASSESVSSTEEEGSKQPTADTLDKEVESLFPKSNSPGKDQPEEQQNKETFCAFCSKPAITRCTGCRLVFYCGRECQKGHWKEHKDVCRPYVISKRKDIGRYLEASRDITADDVILEEAPLVIGPRQNTEPVCLSCYKRISGDYQCSRCSWPLCSVECEKQRDHEYECEITERSRMRIHIEDFDTPNHLYEVITALRCLVVSAREPRKWATSVDRMNARFLQLIGSPQYLHQQQVLLPALKGLLKGKLEPLVSVSDSDIHKVLGLFQTNSVPTKLPYAEVQGLYSMASLMSHSCIPNTRLLWEDSSKRLIVKASENIPKGEPITTLYTDILWGTRARRDHLQQTRCVSCSCKRCRDPTEMGTSFSALICRRCQKRSPVLSTSPLDNDAPWECIACHHQVPSEEVLQTTLAIGAAVSSALSNPSIETLEAVQHEWLPRVHSHHYHLHALRHSLLQLYGRKQEGNEDKDEKHWEEIAKKEKACKDFLKVCSLLDPALAYTIPFVGLTFFEYHKTILQNAKKNFGLSKLTTHQLKKRMLLAKALLKKAMEIFRNEAEDTPEGQLYLTCQQEVIAIGRWMLAVGLI